MPPREIPGFYYDAITNKYYKTPPPGAPNHCSSERVKKLSADIRNDVKLKSKNTSKSKIEKYADTQIKDAERMIDILETQVENYDRTVGIRNAGLLEILALNSCKFSLPLSITPNLDYRYNNSREMEIKQRFQSMKKLATIFLRRSLSAYGNISQMSMNFSCDNQPDLYFFSSDGKTALYDKLAPKQLIENCKEYRMHQFKAFPDRLTMDIEDYNAQFSVPLDHLVRSYDGNGDINNIYYDEHLNSKHGYKHWSWNENERFRYFVKKGYKQTIHTLVFEKDGSSQEFDSEIMCMAGESGSDYLFIGTRGGYVWMKHQKKIFKLKFGPPVCDILYMKYNGMDLLVVSGIQNCLKSYKIRKDKFRLEPFMTYLGYICNCRLVNNLHQDSTAKSDGIFVIESELEDKIVLKGFHILSPAALEARNSEIKLKNNQQTTHHWVFAETFIFVYEDKCIKVYG